MNTKLLFGVIVCTLAVCRAATAAPAINLVQNGDFENGDFSYWSLTGDVAPALVFEAAFVNTTQVLPHSGNYQAFLGTLNSAGILSQTLTTSPSQVYLLSFWANGTDGELPNSLQVNWNGSTVTNITSLPAMPVSGWINFQFLVTANAASTTLQYVFRDDPSWIVLDDVSAVAVPEPSEIALLVFVPAMFLITRNRFLARPQ